MTSIEQIEDAVKSLSEKELAEFRAWFADFDEANLNHRAESIRLSIDQHQRGESRDGFAALNDIKAKLRG